VLDHEIGMLGEQRWCAQGCVYEARIAIDATDLLADLVEIPDLGDAQKRVLCRLHRLRHGVLLPSSESRQPHSSSRR
jgi:hypothetical protein